MGEKRIAKLLEELKEFGIQFQYFKKDQYHVSKLSVIIRKYKSFMFY